MRRNQVGTSNIYVSELTLGCMSLGTDFKQARYIIDKSIDAGINHLDTADLYDFGLNEEIVGHAIQNKRDQIILTSKVGNHFNAKTKEWFWDPSKEHIESGIKDSLRRLNTDYLDIYMMHGGTIEDNIDETIQTLDKLKQEGTIRTYGISSIRPNVIREYVKHSTMDVVMMQYNLFDRRPEEEILDLLKANNIHVLARGPLAKGMLSNNGASIIASKGKNGYLDYSFTELNSMFNELEALKSGFHTMNELAFQYVLKHPAVVSVVFGASSVEQVEENVHVQLEPMDDKVYKQIQQITKPIIYTNHR